MLGYDSAPDGEYLHVGKTKKGRSGLLGRVWQQHYQTGGSPGDLIEKVRARGYGTTAGEAREYISRIARSGGWWSKTTI